MANQNAAEEEYPEGIQRVIDRFVSGEIEVKEDLSLLRDENRRRKNPPSVTQHDYYKTYEEAISALETKREQRKWEP